MTPNVLESQFSREESVPMPRACVAHWLLFLNTFFLSPAFPAFLLQGWANTEWGLQKRSKSQPFVINSFFFFFLQFFPLSRLCEPCMQVQFFYGHLACPESSNSHRQCLTGNCRHRAVSYFHEAHLHKRNVPKLIWKLFSTLSLIAQKVTCSLFYEATVGNVKLNVKSQ